MADEKTGEPVVPGEQTIDKAEFEKLKGDYEALKKSNEDMHREFMGEEYLEFLNRKDNPPAKEAAKVETPALTDDLTPREKMLIERARKEAESKFESRLSETELKRKEENDARTHSEIKKFSTKHEDFDTYRPIMYGLSLDPKNADLGLDELYAKAKSHVKSLAGASEEDKEKSRKSGGEKPGASSASFKKGAGKLSFAEQDEDTWEEVVGSKGLPPAV